jgi:hypothetical protein
VAIVGAGLRLIGRPDERVASLILGGLTLGRLILGTWNRISIKQQPRAANAAIGRAGDGVQLARSCRPITRQTRGRAPR